MNFYCVDNQAIKEDETDNFKKYCELRDSDKAYYVYEGCRRKWMNVSSDERGCAGINYLWPITSDEDFQDALEKVKKETDIIIFLQFLHIRFKMVLKSCGWEI